VEEKSFVVQNLKGEDVRYTYREDAEGRRYMVTAMIWYERKKYALRETNRLASTDPLGAASVSMGRSILRLGADQRLPVGQLSDGSERGSAVSLVGRRMVALVDLGSRRLEAFGRRPAGGYMIVTHPDRTTHGYTLKQIVRERNRTLLLTAQTDPGFGIDGDGSSEMKFYPFIKWNGRHRFRIENDVMRI
jgi:hypothetical protein